MKRLLNVSIAAVILLCLLGYMLTYTVRFNETAILTRFGAADESGVVNAPTADGGPGDQAGLHFKWPWPVEQVARVYDTRVQVLESALEQASTSDTKSVDLRLFLTWRINDPLAFYNKLGSVQEAQNTLQVRARDSFGVIGGYTFDELTNVDPTKLKLAEAEAKIKSRIQDRLDEIGYGLTVQEVGIKRILLPTSITAAVEARMRAERERIATSARVQGETASRTLRSTANSNAAIIASFAGSRASRIQADGNARAAEYFARFAEDQDFAIFLAQLDALQQALSQKTRFVLDAENPPFNLLKGLLPNGAAPATRPAPEDSRGRTQARAGTAVPPLPDVDR